MNEQDADFKRKTLTIHKRKNDQKLKTFDTWDRQINPTQPPCAEAANNGGGQPSPEPPRDIGKKPKNLTSDQKPLFRL